MKGRVAWLKIPIVGFFLFTLSMLLVCQDRRVEFDLSCLKLPTVVEQGNASFSIIYRCEINDKGKAKKIHAVADRVLKPGKVASCLKKWRFFGFPPPGGVHHLPGLDARPRLDPPFPFQPGCRFQDRLG